MKKKAGDIAAAHFEKGFNCAESVLLAMVEIFGIETALAPRIASGFGGGMGGCGYVCGAFTGAVIGFGLLSGRDNPGDDRTKCYAKAREFDKQFIERFGAADCLTLIGFDMRTPEGHAAAREAGVWKIKCPVFVREAAEMAVEIAAAEQQKAGE